MIKDSEYFQLTKKDIDLLYEKLNVKDSYIEQLKNIIQEMEIYLRTHSVVDFNSSDIILHEQLALNMVYEYFLELKKGVRI